MEKNTYMTFQQFCNTRVAKIVAGSALLSVMVSQTLLPVTLFGQTSSAFDLNAVILGNASMSNLVNANATMKAAQTSLLAASSTLTGLTNQYDAAQSQVITTAMTQGLTAPAITLDQITDASKILPADALMLAQTSVNESVAAGALRLTQVRRGNVLTSQEADTIAHGALIDEGIDINYISKYISTNSNYDERDRYWYLDFMARATSSLMAYANTLTIPVARDLVGTAYFGSGDPYSGWGGGQYQYAFGTAFDTGFRNAINSALTRMLSGSVLSYTGVLDIPSYRTLFANVMISQTGIGNASTLAQSLGAQTIAAFRTAVRNAIHNQITLQVEEIWKISSPTGIETAIADKIYETGSTLSASVRSLAEEAVDDAIQSGGLQLTAIKDLARVSESDIRNLVSAGLADTGLIASVSQAQLSTITGNVTTQFLLSNKTVTLDDIKTIIATQIGTTLALPNPATLVTQMTNQMNLSLTTAIRNATVNNVMSQMTSLASGLDPEKLKQTIANSILATTGIGDLANIQTALSSLNPAALLSIKTDIEAIVANQQALLATALNPANVENLIATQMTTLTGLGSIANVSARINDTVMQALSPMTQIGAQLNGITESLTSALNSVTLGLNSLTSKFNNTLANMTALTQLNIANLASSVTGLVSNLTSEISGSISTAIAPLTGIANGISASGVAAVASVTSLSNSLTGITASSEDFYTSGSGTSQLSGSDGVSGESDMTSVPFGGPIVYAWPCTCSYNYKLTITNYANGGTPEDIMFEPGRTILYPQEQIYRSGPMTIGLYAGTSYSECVTYIGFSCSSFGGGPVMTMVGTSY